MEKQSLFILHAIPSLGSLPATTVVLSGYQLTIPRKLRQRGSNRRTQSNREFNNTAIELVGHFRALGVEQHPVFPVARHDRGLSIPRFTPHTHCRTPVSGTDPFCSYRTCYINPRAAS